LKINRNFSHFIQFSANFASFSIIFSRFSVILVILVEFWSNLIDFGHFLPILQSISVHFWSFLPILGHFLVISGYFNRYFADMDGLKSLLPLAVSTDCIFYIKIFIKNAENWGFLYIILVKI
jgi:hypothetical protein